MGVIIREGEEELVQEFFELFKTSWEFHRDDNRYDIILCTGDVCERPNAKLTVIYGSKKKLVDSILEVEPLPQARPGELFWKGVSFPVYADLSLFEIKGKIALTSAGFQKNYVATTCRNQNNIVRIGYDLFSEIDALLSIGQPVEYSRVPTIDIHIGILRDLMIESRIPFAEIPPFPYGFDFISCLTHDIDFNFLRNHRADLTLVGLLYRTSLGALLDWIKGLSSTKKLIQRWKFLLELPLIYAGLRNDPWVPSRDYPQVEKDLPATYFFIPFKNRAGTDEAGEKIGRRACKYEIGDLGQSLRQLIENSNEVGVHGLNAWKDIDYASQELKKIAGITQSDDLGVRMHWLLFNQQTPKILEGAGYLYDSSLGYNDAVGYRNGTVQPFRFPNLQSLMELPLNVQDTAMLYKSRMGLQEDEALYLVNQLIENHRYFGGVLTLNWHDRSLAPERLWKDIYLEILKKLRKEKTLFLTMGHAAKWFKKRRSIDMSQICNRLNATKDEESLTPLVEGEPFLRIFNPDPKEPVGKLTYKDISLNGFIQ